MKASIVSPSGRPPMGVRARLSSLGSVQAVARSRRLSSYSNNAAKRILSSSTVTLQGPKRPREVMRPLSPTSSQPSPEHSTTPDASSENEEDSSDEQRKIDEQETLRLKLENLQKLMTADTLGLVASPSRMSASRSRYSEKGKGREQRRGRDRPLSSSSSGQLPRLETLAMTRRHSANHTPSHHSLSSASANSPQGSIPSIPSPPPETPSRPAMRQTPLHAGPPNQPGKSISPPPTISRNSAWGQNALRNNHVTNAVGRPKVGGGRSERGSEVGSSTSSLSYDDLLSGKQF